MGKSKKKKKISKKAAAERRAAAALAAEEAELQQRREDERRADEALAKGMESLGISHDSDLFAPIPPTEDCAICMVPLPVCEGDTTYLGCCGKTICNACAGGHEAAQKEAHTPLSCEFCRAPFATSKVEYLLRYEKRIQCYSDTDAMVELAQRYKYGECDWIDQNERKGFELTLQAAELGVPSAFNLLACFYIDGAIVRATKVKERVCKEAAARGGYYLAHRNLGRMAYESDGMQLALKHYQFAASTGFKDAVDRVQKMNDNDLVGKDDFTAVLRDYQTAFILYSRKRQAKI